MSGALKACPFCGGEAGVVDINVAAGWRTVRCAPCHLGPMLDSDWNHRPLESALATLVLEAFREKLSASAVARWEGIASQEPAPTAGEGAP